MTTAIGSGPAVHEWVGPTGKKFRDVREPSGTYYHDTVPRKVIDVLEACMGTGKHVRLWIGDKDTGRCWMDEYDVAGTVSRSMGPIKIPILLRSYNSTGGPAILCDCIIRIMVNGVEEYRHPKFNQPKLTIGKGWSHEHDAPKGRVFQSVEVGVYADGEPFAGFKTERAAQRWIDFMEGRRMAK